MEINYTPEQVAEMKRLEMEAYEAENRARADREKYLELGNRSKRRRLKALERKQGRP